MTIAEWIDRSGRPVPAAFRPSLDAEGTASAEALLQAAQRKARACTPGVQRDRAAAFSLLCADAYITSACLWAVRNGGGSRDLGRMTTRVADAAWRE